MDEKIIENLKSDVRLLQSICGSVHRVFDYLECLHYIDQSDYKFIKMNIEEVIKKAQCICEHHETIIQKEIENHE